MNSKFNLRNLDSVEVTVERSKFIEKYYPQYKKYDYANIVYSCCKAYERIILSNFYDEKIIENLQKLIRKYLFYFLLCSKSKESTKLFSIICFIDMDLCKKNYNNLKG